VFSSKKRYGDNALFNRCPKVSVCICAYYGFAIIALISAYFYNLLVSSAYI